MNDRLNNASAAKVNKATESLKTRTTLIVAGVAAVSALVGSLGTALFNYSFTEKARTEISRELKDLQAASVAITQAAQKTAENVSATDVARLAMQRQLADIEMSRLKMQEQVVALDKARFEMQLENAMIQAKNDTSRTTLAEATRLQELTIRANELKTEITPNFKIDCQTDQFSQISGLIECTIINTGKQVLESTLSKLEVGERVSDEPTLGAIKYYKDSGQNIISPGGSAKHFIKFELTPAASSIKDRMFIFSFSINTEKTSVEQAKKLARGIMKSSELEKASLIYLKHRLYL